MHRTSAALSMVFLTGCGMFQSHHEQQVTERPRAAFEPKPTQYTLRVRNNCLSLLYDLLRDEQNVSKLLIIKHESKPLHDVIKRISSGSADGVKLLELLAKQDSTLGLTVTDLPPGEKATRDAESTSTGKELLHGKGAEFEFKLLMSQAEAMKYASNLAQVASSDEPDTTRRKQLTELSQKFRGYYEDVVKLLRPNVSAGK